MEDQTPTTESYDAYARLQLPPGTPFRRARLTFHAIYRALGLPKAERAGALSEIREYKGRGKNYNYPFIAKIENRRDEDRSKYKPHQGKKEMARRA